MNVASRLLILTVSFRLRADWSGQRRRAALQVEEELCQSCRAAGGVGLLTGRRRCKKIYIYRGFFIICTLPDKTYDQCLKYGARIKYLTA